MALSQLPLSKSASTPQTLLQEFPSSHPYGGVVSPVAQDPFECVSPTPRLLSRITALIVSAWEKAMAPHSSTLSWKIPWTEAPGRLQSMGSLRVGHDSVTSLSLFTFMHWRRKCQPLQCSCLANPRDGEAWWGAVYGVTQSWTRLKQLSSSSSSKLEKQNINKRVKMLQ